MRYPSGNIMRESPNPRTKVPEVRVNSGRKRKEKKERSGACIFDPSMRKALFVFQRASKKWSWPKGKKKKGEDNVMCMYRELEEETGLDLKNVRHTILKYFPYNHKRDHMYVIRLLQPIAIPTERRDVFEIEKVKWWDPKTLIDSSSSINKLTKDTIKVLIKHRILRPPSVRPLIFCEGKCCMSAGGPVQKCNMEPVISPVRKTYAEIVATS